MIVVNLKRVLPFRLLPACTSVYMSTEYLHAYKESGANDRQAYDSSASKPYWSDIPLSDFSLRYPRYT
jgi:hypothetical protein